MANPRGIAPPPHLIRIGAISPCTLSRNPKGVSPKALFGKLGEQALFLAEIAVLSSMLTIRLKECFQANRNGSNSLGGRQYTPVATNQSR